MTLFLSHRGESDDAPENTMESFRLAMERDSDGIELDVRLSADGKAACFHDETLDRVAGVPLRVADSTLSEMRKYYPVPLLAEALAVLKPGRHMQIEFKGIPSALEPGRAAIEAWNGDRAQLAISSFEPETIAAAADCFPDLPRLLLLDQCAHFGRFPSPEELSAHVKQFRCTGVSFKADFRADRRFVEALRATGLRVVAWGVSSDELGLAMAESGVDAMTCNHAVALRRLYRLKR